VPPACFSTWSATAFACCAAGPAFTTSGVMCSARARRLACLARALELRGDDGADTGVARDCKQRSRPFLAGGCERRILRWLRAFLGVSSRATRRLAGQWTSRGAARPLPRGKPLW
jgi:hypothetical protein